MDYYGRLSSKKIIRRNGTLDSGESTEEERIAYSYVLRRFISDLLDDRYTINM